MKTVLMFFSKLSDEDIDWLVGAGKVVELKPPFTLITEMKPIDDLYITISGTYKITKNQQFIDTAGAGEILGELSFLDSRPPLATVTVKEEGAVLAVPVVQLHSKLRSDAGFASRFYLALGIIVADRLRHMESRMASNHYLDTEIGSDILDETGIAAARFQRLRKAAFVGLEASTKTP